MDNVEWKQLHKRIHYVWFQLYEVQKYATNLCFKKSGKWLPLGTQRLGERSRGLLGHLVMFYFITWILFIQVWALSEDFVL